MITIENLSKKFRKQTALNNISVDLQENQVIALIGPNGSGKTTLIKSILGLVRPNSGNIYFNGELVSKNVTYRKNIGYMPQIGRYPDNMKIGHLFEMIRNIRANETNVDLELYYKFRLDEIVDKPMRTLSGGTRQKVSSALAFLFNPAVLILDEPTAGLDPLASEILKSKIAEEKKKGKLIIITSHILSDLDELATHIMYMQEGNLLFYNTMEQLQTETGEEKLNKAIASIMKRTQPKSEVKYLKIAN